MFAGGWKNIDYIATNAEVATLKSDIVAMILNFGEHANKCVKVVHLATGDADSHFVVVFW